MLFYALRYRPGQMATDHFWAWQTTPPDKRVLKVTIVMLLLVGVGSAVLFGVALTPAFPHVLDVFSNVPRS